MLLLLFSLASERDFTFLSRAYVRIQSMAFIIELRALTLLLG